MSLQRLANVKTKALLVSERRVLDLAGGYAARVDHNNRVGAIKLARVGLAVLSFGTSELAHAAAHEGAVSAAEAFIQSAATSFTHPIAAAQHAFSASDPGSLSAHQGISAAKTGVDSAGTLAALITSPRTLRSPSTTTLQQVKHEHHLYAIDGPYWILQRNDSYRCNICMKDKEHVSYNCGFCMYDECPDCYKGTASIAAESKQPDVPHEHYLILEEEAGQGVCDVCRRYLPQGDRHRCAHCNYDECVLCALRCKTPKL